MHFLCELILIFFFCILNKACIYVCDKIEKYNVNSIWCSVFVYMYMYLVGATHKGLFHFVFLSPCQLTTSAK